MDWLAAAIEAVRAIRPAVASPVAVACLAAVANPVAVASPVAAVANHPQPTVAAFATRPAVVPRDSLAAAIEAERAILLELGPCPVAEAFPAAAFPAAASPVVASPVASCLVAGACLAAAFPAAGSKRIAVAWQAVRAG